MLYQKILHYLVGAAHSVSCDVCILTLKRMEELLGQLLILVNLQGLSKKRPGYKNRDEVVEIHAGEACFRSWSGKPLQVWAKSCFSGVVLLAEEQQHLLGDSV
jgi:hypothetical protein